MIRDVWELLYVAAVMFWPVLALIGVAVAFAMLRGAL